MTLSELQCPSAHRGPSLALSPCSPLEGSLMDQLWFFHHLQNMTQRETPLTSR